MHAIYNLQNTITHSILGLKILFFESLTSFILYKYKELNQSLLGAQLLDCRIQSKLHLRASQTPSQSLESSQFFNLVFLPSYPIRQFHNIYFSAPQESNLCFVQPKANTNLTKIIGSGWAGKLSPKRTDWSTDRVRYRRRAMVGIWRSDFFSGGGDGRAGRERLQTFF
jgi:hypothetical protein